jgi:hypothetical protein
MKKLLPFKEELIAEFIIDMPDWMHPIQWWRRQFYLIADEAVGITLDREMKKMRGDEPEYGTQW